MNENTVVPVGPAGGRYEKLKEKRTPYLDRARECAKYTIPSLLPSDSHNYTSDILTPYQSFGSRGVNNLASKLLMATLPPNSPFFRFKVDQYALKELQAEEDKANLEEALAEMERMIMDAVETSADRVSAHEMYKHLLVTGNVLIYKEDYTKQLRIFHLTNYVIRRDPSGNPLEIVVHESVDPLMLPEEIRGEAKLDETTKSASLYTHVKRGPKNWEVYQEAYGKVIPGSKGTYPLEQCPWIPLRGIKVDGEDYGRSFVEEYLGDLKSLDGLSQAILEGSAAAAKLLILVNPNGTTRISKIESAPSGAIIPGNAEDVSVLQMEKQADFQIALEMIARIEERLSYVFLLNSAIQRNAERVTAEEIRYMAEELETALGGFYSIMSQEFQLPYANLQVFRMQKANKLPKLPKDLVKPSIVTGLEALGRGNDLNKLDLFLGGAVNILGPEIISQYVNIGDYFTRRAAAIGIDKKGLIKSEEEIAMAQQEAQQQQMVAQFGPEVIKQAGGMMQKGMENGQQQAAPEG